MQVDYSLESIRYNINVINFRDCITRGSQFTIACQLDINDADGNSVPADEFEGNVFVAHLSLLLENGEEVSSFIECSSSIFYEGNTVSEGFQDGGAILFEFENLKIHYPGSYCFKIVVFDMEQVLVGPMFNQKATNSLCSTMSRTVRVLS